MPVTSGRSSPVATSISQIDRASPVGHDVVRPADIGDPAPVRADLRIGRGRDVEQVAAREAGVRRVGWARPSPQSMCQVPATASATRQCFIEIPPEESGRQQSRNCRTAQGPCSGEWRPQCRARAVRVKWRAEPAERPGVTRAARAKGEAPSWRRSSASSTTIRSTAIQPAIRAIICRTSTAIRMARSLPTPKAIDFQPGAAAWQRRRRAGPSQIPRGRRAPAGRHRGQGRTEFRLRARAGRRRRRHFAAILAGLSDRGTDRQGEEPQARDHRRHRIRPCRPCRPQSIAGSPLPKSPTATRSALPSMW